MLSAIWMWKQTWQKRLVYYLRCFTEPDKLVYKRIESVKFQNGIEKNMTNETVSKSQHPWEKLEGQQLDL